MRQFKSPTIGIITVLELRDVYVISLKRLPQYAGGYCYGDRVIYVDQRNFFPNDVDLPAPTRNAIPKAIRMRPAGRCRKDSRK
ncbi:MAG: hypothetical protein ACREP6_00250 [Candidatus Binataceae bacterium]